jgi:hypothetical protein
LTETPCWRPRAAGATRARSNGSSNVSSGRVWHRLRYVGELSYEEIGVRTEQDANTVGVQLRRARRRLKDELRGGGHCDG